MEEIVAKKYLVLANELNERQRRLWAASEALRLGHGGIAVVAKATGMSGTTMTQGVGVLRKEQRLEQGRVRRTGGGRKKATEKQPDLLPSLDALVEPTAKGDPIEHRLFNHVSMNWKGQPLVSMDVVINLIGNTTSRTGLKAYAMKDESRYPTGRKISDKEMDDLNVVKKDVPGKWNYMIKPR